MIRFGIERTSVVVSKPDSECIKQWVRLGYVANRNANRSKPEDSGYIDVVK